MEKGAEKNTENDVSKIFAIMQQIKLLELIHLFVFLSKNKYYLLKNVDQ